MATRSEIGVAFGPGPMTVAGRYRLIAVVGTGGMGRIWRAHDELLDRVVAVKELFAGGDRQEARVQVEQEAAAAARLDHPNVVRVFDVVRATGRSWIVMEYVPSRSLHEVVTRDGPLTHREAARVGLAVLDALTAAHDAGLLHLDVKPHNVLIADDDRVVLTDFGLAMDATQEKGPMLGSPNYVAPERVRNGRAGVKSDLWSLGATLYAAVEGRPPFSRPSVKEALAALLTDDPDPTTRPGPLHPVIAGLLTRDSAKRPGTKATRAALQKLSERAIGIVAVPLPLPAVAVEKRATPKRTKVVVAAVGSVLAVAAAITFSVRTEPADPAPDSASTSISASASTSAEAAAGAPSVALVSCAAMTATGRPASTTGFQVPIPQGWTRTSTPDGTVCFSDPDGARTFTVRSIPPVTGDPLRYWETAEAASALTAYQRISMGVLLVTGGGADWEFSWQPPGGPRLHSHKVLVARKFELTWTTRDQDWNAGLSTQRTFLDGFRDPTNSASPWAVPGPGPRKQ
ncbi:hypothetical protein GCM10010435_08130 [Winogradskya consettensis]|uniref:non-specific serine/threonine protein kinase n=1 Tax=Winogradskya consettensis TaxID=113560 RepID=A0A919SXF1_9ACTN|nr:serine/threonine-protein kinase [Actinoplanes consettensis]GIM80461.1 hypothetical protein Aco04nite_70850 [Actinoplanes consettensis]